MIDTALQQLLAAPSIQGAADVCLVRMPYPSLEYPSIALGLLKASLADHPLSCQVIYADLLFADLIGLPAYRMLNIGDRYDLLGEWSFTSAAFPEFAADHETHLQHFTASFCSKFGSPNDRAATPEILDELHQVRAAAAAFTQALAERIVAKRPKLVGCSSTFEQHVPSLGLLRMVKTIDPEIVTLLGGANCESEMGLATAEAFPWVDFVFSGEADTAFPELCRLIARHGAAIPESQLPFGTLSRPLVDRIAAARKQGESVDVPRAILPDMNASPVPDYSDYYAQMRERSYAASVKTGMLLETSRGCWWGEKHSCTFCGLNGCGLRYRAKSADRALADFDEATTRHAKRQFALTDAILHMDYFRTLLPDLARRGAPYSIFCEVKANLSREQMRTLRSAGVKWCQPGIEGLHDAMLKLMGKGTRTLINVQFLKYACELGIYPIWHLLVCFPGEDDAWHLETAAWLPLIYHLQPVQGIKPIRYDRFSAYQRDPARYDIQIAPFGCYRGIYPHDDSMIERLAYYFEDADAARSFQRGDRVPPGVQALLRREREWNTVYRFSPERPILAMTDRGDEILIIDTRPCALQRRIRLTGMAADVYRACDPAATRELLGRRLAERTGRSLSVSELEDILQPLIEQRLLLAIDGAVLALAVPGLLPETEHRRLFPSGDAPLPSVATVCEERRQRPWTLNPSPCPDSPQEASPQTMEVATHGRSH